MSEILPGKLFLGAVQEATSAEWLRVRAVHTVITVLNPDPDLMECVRAACRAASVRRLVTVGVEDDPTIDLSTKWPMTNRIINDHVVGDDSGAVLVYCMAGVSRSATLVLAYLVEMRQMRLDAAMRLVLAQRPFIHPNDGFLRQLVALEQRVHALLAAQSIGEITQMLVQYRRQQEEEEKNERGVVVLGEEDKEEQKRSQCCFG